MLFPLHSGEWVFTFNVPEIRTLWLTCILNKAFIFPPLKWSPINTIYSQYISTFITGSFTRDVRQLMAKYSEIEIELTQHSTFPFVKVGHFPKAGWSQIKPSKPVGYFVKGISYRSCAVMKTSLGQQSLRAADLLGVIMLGGNRWRWSGVTMAFQTWAMPSRQDMIITLWLFNQDVPTAHGSLYYDQNQKRGNLPCHMLPCWHDTWVWILLVTDLGRAV